MSITDFSIKHYVSVYVLIVCLVLGGLMAYFALPREAAPDIAIPVVIVSTPYFGVSPADIETLVTQPLEKEFKSLRSLKTMTSTSAESVSLITLEFEPDVDIEDALQRIRVQVDKARPDLPSDAEEPEVMEINASDWPILVANVSGDLDPVRLKDLAENIVDDIENISGVLRVSLAGGVEREIQILVDPDKLRHQGVSMNDVIGAIQNENVNVPGGSLDIGSMKYIVRVAGEFRDLETMRHIVVKAQEGQPVYLRHVAEVKDSFKEQTTTSRLTTWSVNEQGERVMITRPNVSLSIVKRAGENIITIADEAKEVIARYDAMAGEDVHITIVNDMSENIRQTVHDLENQIISGMILVLLVLFFFMGGARNALFVAVSVPLSMLITFLVLSFMGVTLNMVVLFSLLLALGMLVDNAIVVVENIYRHASEGKDRITAAYEGTREVGWAIIASTATTVAAFFPMLFWPGVMGKFMGFLPLTVIITLVSSLFVALVINPTLCSRLLKVKSGISLSEDSVPDNILYRMYKGTLEWALNYRVFVTILVGIVFVGTFAVFGKTNRGVEFFPQTTPEQFSVQLSLPDGTNLTSTKEVLEAMQEPLFGAPDLVMAWITDAGIQGGGQIGGGGEAPHYGQITVELVDHDQQPSDPLVFMDKLRKIFGRIPGATVILERQSMGPPTGSPISIEIAGDNLSELSRIAREIREKIRPIPGIIDLQDNLELSRPEIHVEVDRQRAVMAGLSTQSIAQTVRTAINGTKAGNFREGEDEFDITVRLPDERRLGITDIASLTVVNNDGVHIPLTEVAHVEVRGGSGSIRRKNQERVVTISGNAADGYLAANLLGEVQELLEDYVLPAGYQLRFTGESEDQAEAAEFLSIALLAALFLIILILVTEFNSITQPFIILCSVLLSLIGVLWSLILTGMPFGIIMTGIGIISLSGVVVNNAIVLIDYINQLRARGLDRREAVIQAGLVRFRPVMLTAITTILGLLPLVLGVSIDFVNQRIATGGASVEMWAPMAIVVTGGLLVATLLTLVVVPVLYSLFDEMAFRTQQLATRLLGATAIFTFFIVLPMSFPVTAVAQDAPEAAQEQQGQEQQEGYEPALPIPRPDPTYEPLESQDLGVFVERTLHLEEARRLVWEESFDVQLAESQVAVADGVIRQAWGALHPTLSANANYTVNQKEVVLDFSDQIPFPGFEMEPTIVQPKTDWRWSLSASMRMNFRSYPMIRQAYAQRDLMKNQVAIVQESLDAAVVQAYYNLLTLRRVIELSAQQVESSQTMLRATEARVRAGTATDFELTRARLRLVQTEKALERSRLQFVQVRQALAQVLQTTADFDVTNPPAPTAPQAPQALSEQARDNRATVQADFLNIIVAQRSLEEVYWRYMPAFSATFTYTGARETAFTPSDPMWMLTFGAEWTLWDGGMREAEIQQRRAQLVAAKIRQRQTLHQLDSEIQSAWTEYLSASTQVESGQSEIELAQRGLEQAEIAYRHGVGTQLDVINAQDQLLLAQISYVQDQLLLELAVQNLRTLAGDR